MATTAHEVSLGVSVDSIAAEESLRRLADNVTNLGSVFSGNVLSQIQRFNANLFGLSTGAQGVAAAANTVSAPLTRMANAFAGFSNKVQALNFNNFVSELGQLQTAAANFDANDFSTKIQAISTTLAGGASQVAGYATAIGRLSRGLRSVSANNISAYFAEQIQGVRGLVAVLNTGLVPIQSYSAALRGIASASRSIAGTYTSVGTLSSQAAGLQLLANTVSANITNIQAYAAAMRVLGSSMGGISRGASSIGTLATGMRSLTALSATVVPAVNAIAAAIPPLTSALRSAATAAGRLVSRMTELQRLTAMIPATMGAGTSSMGLFRSMMTVASNAIANQGTLLRRLSTDFSNVARSSREVNLAGSAKEGASAWAALGAKVAGVASVYFGAHAIRGFGEEVIQTGADFDNAMGMVRAVSRNTSDYSNASFMAMEREAFRMGRTTTYSATKAAEALKELTQGGLTTQQAVQSLGDTLMLAETEAMSMADASRIVTSIMAQFQASASELSDYVDKLAKTSAVSKTSIDQLKYAMAYVGTAARSANQSFAEVVSAIGALSTAGVEASQAGTTLRDMLSDLTDTTSYASRKLAALGLDMSKVNPRANSLSSIIGTLKDRGIDAADAMAIFGVRGGLAAGSLITVYKEYLQVLNAVQNQSKGTAAIMQQDVTNNLRKDLDKLAASWDYLVNRIFRSGFGDLMRKVVQQARELTIQVADFADMLTNAGRFNELSTLISASLKYGIASAINLWISMTNAAANLMGTAVKNAFNVLRDTSFWTALRDTIMALGQVLLDGVRLVGSALIDANQEFAKSLVQTMILAGDLFISKMEQAMVIGRQITSPSYLTARIEAKNANARVLAGQSSMAYSNLLYAVTDLKATTEGTTQREEAQSRVDIASKAYNAYMAPLLAAQDAAIKKLEQESAKVGEVPEFTKKFADYGDLAAGIIGDISTGRVSLQKQAGENNQKLVDAAAILSKKVTQSVVDPILSEAKNLKYIEVFNTKEYEDQIKGIVKRNAATPPGAPTKTLEAVTTAKVGQGVGEIRLGGESKGAGGSRGPVVSSMVEVGGGIANWFGSTASPLEDAMNENANATRELTAAITGKTGEGGKTATALPNYSVSEAAYQTELQMFARTGRTTERLRQAQAERLAPQVEIERADREKRIRESEIAAQRANKQANERITSTLGIGFDIGAPFSQAVKKGLAVAFDKEGNAIQQSALELGQSVTKDLGYTATAGVISGAGMQDVIGMLRRGVSKTSIESVAPISLTEGLLKDLKTGKPLDTGALLGIPTAERMLNAPALPITGAGGFGMNMPDVSATNDTGPQQVAILSTIQSVLQSIDSKTKNNTGSSNALTITIA